MKRTYETSMSSKSTVSHATQTIGAFDSDGWPPTSGALVYVPNAIGDSPKFMMEFGRIYRPGQPNALAFADLVDLAENYDQGQEVPYDYWPDCVDGARNSNGFTVGLLKTKPSK